MVITLLFVIVSVFFVICLWSAWEIYIDKRKEYNQSFKAIPQSTEEHQ